MTSLLAWSAYDSRYATSLYIASDSRVTFKNGSYRDNCAKTYVAVAGTNQSAIFGFCGDVEFSQLALDRVCEAIENQEIPIDQAATAEARSEWVHAFLGQQLVNSCCPLQWDTTILHGSRDSWGPQASFTLHRYHGPANGRSLKRTRVQLDRTTVYAKEGTGGKFVMEEVIEVRAATGDYSRAYFAGFCDSLRTSSGDKYSGGPVQLVGLTQIGDGRHYGVVQQDGAYFRGEVATQNLLGVTWFDSHMQRVDQQGQLLRDAQRQAWTKRKRK